MKSSIVRVFILAGISLFFSADAWSQDECTRNYRTCVRTCNAARDQALSRNNLERSQIRIRLGQQLIQCNVQYVNDRAGRQACRNEKIAAANAELAALDAADRQAHRERLNCISECRRQLSECRQPPAPTPNFGGSFEIECLEGGAPCSGPVSEFCQRAAGACDDCWRSLCGGGEFRIDADVSLRTVTLVAASNPSRPTRVLATSSVRGGRVRLNVPRDIKLNSGEQLYFQFSPRTRPGRAVKVTLTRGGQ